MTTNSKIEWTDHTFNPWVGCTKVGPGCDHCYAEIWDKRTGGDHWGAGKPRRRTTAGNWKLPFKWAAQADEFFKQHGRRQRVFCASLADVFDNAVDPSWREDLWGLVKDTPELDWLLVTKRIGNAAKMLPPGWGRGWPHVMLIATVCNQEEADRDVPKLLDTPARRRGLSCEPLLGPINLLSVGPHKINALAAPPIRGTRIDWVIGGGESGGRDIVRSTDLAWLRELGIQCDQYWRTSYFLKQLGRRPIFENHHELSVTDPKGGDQEEWPYDLRGWRQYPELAA